MALDTLFGFRCCSAIVPLPPVRMRTPSPSEAEGEDSPVSDALREAMRELERAAEDIAKKERVDLLEARTDGC
jgi:hypothetical protein